MIYINLSHKTALITGGSRGIGRATSILLARSGVHIGISYRSRKEEAQETVRLVEAEGSTAWAQAGDLSDEQNVQQLFKRVDQEFPNGLDIFIANAAIWKAEAVPIHKMNSGQWHRTISMNLDAVFFTTKEAIKRIQPHGRVVIISSTAGQRGEAFHADYAASKGALISLVKSLCVELAPKSITVNCVAPGWVDTEMAAPALTNKTLNQIKQSIPLGRIATPEDIAGPILFLCSDFGRHITGEVININGGAVLCG